MGEEEDILMRDVEGGGTRDRADEERRELPSWLCHMAYAYMRKGHREAHTCTKSSWPHNGSDLHAS